MPAKNPKNKPKKQPPKKKPAASRPLAKSKSGQAKPKPNSKAAKANPKPKSKTGKTQPKAKLKPAKTQPKAKPRAAKAQPKPKPKSAKAQPKPKQKTAPKESKPHPKTIEIPPLTAGDYLVTASADCGNSAKGNVVIHYEDTTRPPKTIEFDHPGNKRGEGGDLWSRYYTIPKGTKIQITMESSGDNGKHWYTCATKYHRKHPEHVQVGYEDRDDGDYDDIQIDFKRKDIARVVTSDETCGELGRLVYLENLAGFRILVTLEKTVTPPSGQKSTTQEEVSLSPNKTLSLGCNATGSGADRETTEWKILFSEVH